MKSLAQSSRQEQRGTTLLFAIAILALLIVFTLVFARLMSLERRASASWTDGVRARLASKAGINRAIVEMQKVAGVRHYSDPWFDKWGYLRTAPPGYNMQGDPVELFHTEDPSFKEVDPNGLLMFGNPLVYSGFLGEPYMKGSALIYKLRVLDATIGIPLNHPDSAAAQRMLATIFRAKLGMSQAAADTASQSIVSQRPGGGFSSKTEVQGLALGAAGLTTDQWLQVMDMMAVHGWTDPSTIRPWKLNNVPKQQLSPMPRSPINLNTAPVEVLTAMFAGTSAANELGTFTIDYASAQRLANAIDTYRGTPPFAGTSQFTPFKTWIEFEDFIDALPANTFSTAPYSAPPPPTGGAVDYVPAGGFYETLINQKIGHMDMVKAIANPNSMIKKFGLQPNHGGYLRGVPRLIDKSDLVDMTTEGSFDSMGVYEITSLGMVLVPDEKLTTENLRVIAEWSEQVVVEVYRPVKLTTQEDWERHRSCAIDGTFITTKDTNWDYPGMFGMNKETYFDRADMPLPGWPGVVSWPNYSLVRDSTPNRPLKSPHWGASWGGYLTLTNLIATKTANADFNVGFARGRLEALKGRAYYSPKDETPMGTFINPGNPPNPMGAVRKKNMTDPQSGVNDSNPNNVASPRTRTAFDPTRADVLDEAMVTTPGATALSTAQGMFYNGSSMWNTGLVIGSDRVNAAGSPQYLAYPSNNLDLVRGTSIRFWVQPLIDPFARNKEILFDFVGDRTGFMRQVGFQVYKEALPTGVVNIVLEAIGIVANDESGVYTEYNWASGQGGAGTKISIDVTPTAPYTVDPLNPQWVPHSWHWVVVNIGPGLKSFGGPTEFFASLQVDKKQSSNYLDYKGNNDQPGGNHEYGELHGHVIGTNFNSFHAPLSEMTINDPLVRGWIQPRLLGDFYHCQAGRMSGPVVKSKKFGEPGGPAAVVWQGDSVPFYPWIRPTDTPGSYVPGPAWPSPLPFPALSYQHTILMKFHDGGGGVQFTLPMVRNPQGVFTMSFPPIRHVSFGDDDPVNRPAFTAPSGQIVPPATVTGGYPGDKEWHISLEAFWTEDHYSTPCQFCVADPTIPADPTTLQSIEDDPYNPLFGEGLPYATHNSGPTNKRGIMFSTSQFSGFRSWVRVSGPLDHPQGLEPFFPSGPPWGQFPITYIDDDCHGCENCDVDGPMFIGGSPGGTTNIAATSIMGCDPTTMAHAVFDNIVFINGDYARRTDYPGSNRQNTTGATDPLTGAPIQYNQPAKDFEDRFFEYNLSASLETGGGTNKGFGAIYHRALMELTGQGRLGTMTWTAYPTQGGLGWEVALWRIQNDTTNPTWSPSNSGVISGNPTWGYVDDAGTGITFAGPNDPPTGYGNTQASYDTFTNPNDLLVMAIRLRELDENRGSGEPIPAPLMQTPVFEDLTVTFIHPRATILHAEGDVE